ncbi:uncharacterized protein LOC121983841 [Zingiber officinale]|uniref:Uncharacterized protein n=1 Tax=Zingiber officinale TaxID=94328 RepID=A0A8J5GJ16_ZINOF|nr:uncharacterized protein LOC121983841 [Zingiber officinale]KAG6502498.1 hypothetical protein ZIOFF_034779 [Zingiber officinale]
MAARAFTSLLLALLLLLLAASASADGGRRGLHAYVPSRKRAVRGATGVDCRAMASRAECLGKSEWCRWCRSDALDDMCFVSAEAWRLPGQIFSCEAPSS